MARRPMRIAVANDGSICLLQARTKLPLNRAALESLLRLLILSNFGAGSSEKLAARAKLAAQLRVAADSLVGLDNFV